MVKSPGRERAATRCASATAASSGAWVEAASQTGRPARAARNAFSSPASQPGTGISAFRLPPSRTRPGSAPIATSRAVVSVSWVTIRRNSRTSAAAIPGAHAQRRALRAETRALTNIIGVPHRATATISPGQNSLSAQTARSGRQWSRNRRTAPPVSTGTN